MNILQVINSFKVIGGAERLLSEIVPMMNAQGHHVEVLVLQDSDTFLNRKLKDAGVVIHSLNMKSHYSPLAIWKIRRFLKQHPEFSVVHVHLFPSLYWVAFAASGMNRPLVWTEHSTKNKRWTKWYFRPIDRLVYSQYCKLICISPATLSAIRQWTKTAEDSSRLCVVENGVDTRKFRKTAAAKPYRHTLIQVSRFTAAKDQDTVVRALTLLPNDVHAVFVGEGERLSAVSQLATALNVQERAHFLGARQDVAALLSSADIAIQSSNWEGFGLAAVEAMANELPVIASDVDGLRQVVEGAGLLFPHGNETVLAQQVDALLKNPGKCHDIAKQCLQRAQTYDISIMVKKYIDIYQTISNLKSPQ
jgi:glycosyltransferase involved in cell wall biosynthesis